MFHINSHHNPQLEQPHALYQADGSEEEGECGTTHEHHEDSTNPLNLSEEELDRVSQHDGFPSLPHTSILRHELLLCTVS